VRGPSIEWLTQNEFLVPTYPYCPGEAAMRAILAEVKVRRGDFVTSDLEATLNRKELVGDMVKNLAREGGEPSNPVLCR
jgi:hypothetical protein